MLDKLKKNKQQIEAKEIDESNVDKKDATSYEIESPGKLIIRRLKQNKFAMIGLALLIFMFIFSFIGPLLSPYGYNDRSALIKAAPSLKHWFGTDYLGRDVLTRVMVGGRISIAVGVVSVVIWWKNRLFLNGIYRYILINTILTNSNFNGKYVV